MMKAAYLSVPPATFNGDGHVDLLIGANQHASITGRSYAVFGGPGVGGSGDILLSSLNGANGFKLDGEVSNDASGSSVSAVGDINGDGHADLLIGAPYHTSSTGRSYVVFDGPGVGSSGDILLSSLNGANGFKLDGEANNDASGWAVSAAGDINGDGHADLLIGAPSHASNTGRSYVVFGGPGVGGSGNILLSDLNGTNGFKLDGENNGDLSGLSVTAVGDINDDGYADFIIGAPGYPMRNLRGRSYVIFGSPHVGDNKIIALGSLNGSNGFILDGENNNDQGVQANIISAAGDINNDGCADFLMGASSYPQGNATGRTYVVFGDAPPTLVQNRLSLALGQTITLNQTHLSAYDRNNLNNTIVFTPTNVTHGHFQLATQSGISLTNFTLPQLQSGVVQFVHDGSITAPSYFITVQSAGIAWTGPHPANISFAAPLTLVTNQLTLSNGQIVVLSSNNLQAVDPGVNNNSQIIFTVGNVQNGYFATVPSSNNPSKNLTAFTQAEIQSSAIEFISQAISTRRVIQ